MGFLHAHSEPLGGTIRRRAHPSCAAGDKIKRYAHGAAKRVGDAEAGGMDAVG